MVDPLDNLTSSEQLRRLLVQEEQERIDRLEARLGDDGKLKSSLIPIIADVLRDAGVKDYRQLADALAPIVLQSIKTEIQNSRDMMVDALYPITGRLVAAAVRNAFKDLVDQLNTKLDSTLSIDRWRAKVKAIISGRTEAEVLLSEGAAFEIVELLLINRQSGLLMAQATVDGDRGESNSHLLSSILTAIMAFVRDAMSQSSEQDLRTLHVGDVRLHLQISPGAILAIKTKGPPPNGFETALSETFYAFLTRWGHVLSEPEQLENQDEVALTGDLEDRFQLLLEAKQANFKKPSRKGALLLGSLAAVLVFWLGWTFYGGWKADQIEAMARSVVDQRIELKGYPIRVAYTQETNDLTVSGLVPDKEAMKALNDDLEHNLPDTALVIDVGLLPDNDIKSEDVATKVDLAEWERNITQSLDKHISATSDKVADLEQRLPPAAKVEFDAFRSWVGHQFIRFDNSSQLNNDDRANAVLQRMADSLSQSPLDLRLRVIGYSDDLGDNRANADVSASRAALIATRLVNLGVSSDRLDVVGRGSERRVANIDGAGSANRRVEFELTYGVGDDAFDDRLNGSDHGTR